MGRKKAEKKPWGIKSSWHTKDELKARQMVMNVPEKVGLSFSPELQEKYCDAITVFLADKTQYANPPSLGEKKEMIKGLKEACENFISAIKQFDEHRLGRLLDFEDKNRMQLRKEAIAIAETYLDAANIGHGKLAPLKGKKTGDRAQRNLVKSLAEIYTKATGKGPTTSSSAYQSPALSDEQTDPSSKNYMTTFEKLVSRTLVTLEFAPTSDMAINKAIYRIIKD